MGYLRDFEEDVFISYAHFDDDQYGDEPRGWVAQLHEDLDKCVPVHLGAKASLWRDCQIRDYEDFERKILRRLPKTATFLFINSPSFFNREWCTRELEAFYEHAQKNLGLHVDEDKVRIFKIEKNRVDREKLPATLKINGSYRFYAPDPSNSTREHPLRPKMGPEYFRSYYMKVDDLAKDLADVLQAMANRSQVDIPQSPATTVYLAETTADLSEEALEIRRDLKCRGFSVLPSSELSNQAQELKEQVSGYLKRSVLSIHMVGNDYGPIPEGEIVKSKQWIQHDLAMEREKSGAFTRLIWLPRNVDPKDPRQKVWVDYLHNDKDVQNSKLELLTNRLEELKGLLIDRLAGMKSASGDPLAVRTSPPDLSPSRVGRDPYRVYVMCDSTDHGSPTLHDLRRQLMAAGCEPLLAMEDQDEKLALQEHLDYMTLCDAVLIYYGAGSQRWFHTKLMDLRKYLGKREQPLRAKAIYIAPPATPLKDDFDTLEALVLRGSDPARSIPLDPFLRSLRRQDDENAQ
jgi:TIR domain